MKRYYLATIAVIVSAGLLSGCGSLAAKEASADTGGTTAVSDNSEEGAEVAEQKVLYGEVSDVAGNAIILKLIEMPEIRSFDRGEGGFTGELAEEFFGSEIELDEDGNPVITDEMRQQIAERMAEAGIGRQGGERSGATGGTAPDGEMITRGSGSDTPGISVSEGMPAFSAGEGTPAFSAGEGMPEFSEGEGARTAPGNREALLERAYTGEEVDIIIPVGMPIVTMSYGENGVEETEIKLEKLKAGDIMTVTYAADEVSIEKVVVSQNSGAGGMMAFPGGAREGTISIDGAGTIMVSPEIRR